MYELTFWNLLQALQVIHFEINLNYNIIFDKGR